MVCLVGTCDGLQGDGDGNDQGGADGVGQACSAAPVAPILLRRSASARGGDTKGDADPVMQLLLKMQAEMRCACYLLYSAAVQYRQKRLQAKTPQSFQFIMTNTAKFSSYPTYLRACGGSRGQGAAPEDRGDSGTT
jgi:hypothetical protein